MMWTIANGTVAKISIGPTKVVFPAKGQLSAELVNLSLRVLRMQTTYANLVKISQHLHNILPVNSAHSNVTLGISKMEAFVHSVAVISFVESAKDM